MEYYPPYDGPQPVVFNVGRPAAGYRHRGRRPTDAPQFYTGPNGELLVPAGHQRASSMSGPRPGGIQIVNEQVYADEGRARSIVYPEDILYRRGRSRSHSRSMTREDLENEEKFRRLEELEKKDEEQKREKRYKEKMLLEKAKEEEEKKEKEELKKKAVEEWKEKEREKKEKEKEEREKADQAAEERLRKMLWEHGYTNSQIETMVKRSSEKKEHGPGASTSKVIALSRPTYLRIKTKYLDTDTLDYYRLPWQWDDNDDNYIIIKQWLNERDQEKLFAHTKQLREKKRITYTTTQLRKDKDNQLLLVKKKESKSKSPVRVIRF